MNKKTISFNIKKCFDQCKVMLINKYTAGYTKFFVSLTHYNTQIKRFARAITFKIKYNYFAL